ncbi:MAG: hypothetical protein ACI9XO_004487 [Paraglaciecola sp.]|jgi:hypothetical protein
MHSKPHRGGTVSLISIVAMPLLKKNLNSATNGVGAMRLEKLTLHRNKRYFQK